MTEQLYENFSTVKVNLPYEEGGLIALFHEQGQVEYLENVTGGVVIRGRLPPNGALRVAC